MHPYQGYNRPPVDILPAPTGPAANAGPVGEAPRRKRTRAKRSCDMCRKKKSKCDAEVNHPCTNCKNWKTECVFLVEQKKRGPSTGYVELLESRLKRMEALIDNLARSNGKSDDSASPEDNITPPPSVEDSSNTSQASIGDAYEQLVEPMETINESGAPSFEKSPSNKNVEEQMGGLQIEDYGSMYYMGSSSGIHLIERHMSAGKKIPVPGEKLTYIQKVNDDAAENILVKTEVYSAEDLRAYSNTKKDAEVDDNDLFQDNVLTDQLVNVFFEKIYIYSPFINKTQFEKSYKSEHCNCTDKYLLAAMCGVSTRFLPEEIVYERPKSDGSGFETIRRDTREVGTFFRLKATSILDIAYKRSRISTLQTLLLITMYFDDESENCADENNGMRWFAAGMAIRMAQDLGLHRSATNWNIPKAEIELRRRLWYATYVMDRWVSAELGRPVTILDHDIDVDMPSLYDEIDNSPSCGSSIGSPEENSIYPANNNGKVKHVYHAFIHVIKLTQILGQVLQGLHSPRARSLGRRNESLICFLDGALVRWKLNLPPELEFNESTPASPYRGSVQMCYNLTLLLLHRPASTDTKEKSHTAFQSLSICTNAAHNILCIAESLTCDELLRSPWNITVYTMVQASLIFLHHAMGDNVQLKHCAFNSLLRCLKIFQRKEFVEGTAQIHKVLNLLLALIAIAMERRDVVARMFVDPNEEICRKFVEEVDGMTVLPNTCISDVNMNKERTKRAASVIPSTQSKRVRHWKDGSLMDMLDASETADSTLLSSPNDFRSLLYPATQDATVNNSAAITAPNDSILFGGTGFEVTDTFSLMNSLITPAPTPKVTNPPTSNEQNIVDSNMMSRQQQLPNYAYMSELHAPQDDTQQQDIIQQLFQLSRDSGEAPSGSNDPASTMFNSEIPLWEAPSSMTWNDWDQYVSSIVSS